MRLGDVLPRQKRTLVGMAVLASVLVPLVSTGSGAVQVCNTTPITFTPPGQPTPAVIPFAPYPSVINVSGFTGTITDVNVILNGFTYTFPEDVDVLLVAPNGASALVMSDIGGNNDGVAESVDNINLTFDDQASANAPTDIQLIAGTYRPTDDDDDPEQFVPDNADVFPAPAPAPGPSSLAVFNGLNPNGAWSLYVVDDDPGPPNPGQFGGGWCVDITTGGTPPTTGPGPSTTPVPPTTTTSTTTPVPPTTTTSTTTPVPPTTTTSTTTPVPPTTTTSTTTPVPPTTTTSTTTPVPPTTTTSTTTPVPPTTTTSTTTPVPPTTTTSTTTPVPPTTRPTTTTTTTPGPDGTCGGRTPTIVGTPGADRIFGTSGPDVILGGGGNDSIAGLGGDDVICGGDGDDTIVGGAGNDRIFGDAGNDTLAGESGNDVLHGGTGNDRLAGGLGSDALNGDEGTDLCLGGAGIDTGSGCERLFQVP